MKRALVVACLAVVIAGCGGGAGGTQITGLAGVTTTVTAAPAATTTSVQPHSNGFVVVSIQLRPDPLGYFSGAAQIRNDGKRAHTASMTFTFTEDGKVVGTADALANDVGVGQTVTVQLNSTEKWDGRSVSYAFQVSNLY